MFTFDDEAIPFQPGHTVAAALNAQGIRAFRKSRFLEQERGQFCGIGNCWECLVEHNGQEIRACRTLANDELVLRSASSFGGPTKDSRPATSDTLSVDVTVVGAGPAGLSATKTLTALGVEVLLLDQEPAPGGQLYRKEHCGEPHSSTRVAQHPLVDYRPGVSVWAAEQSGPGHRLLCTGSETLDVISRFVLIATGAQEFTLPFPGWQLPGVTTAGAAQLLAKSQGVHLDGTAMVAGSGPFLLPVAKAVSKAADRTWLIDSGHPLELTRAELALYPQQISQYLGYRRALRSSGVKSLHRYVVLEAFGTNELEAVDIAPLLSGHPERSARERIEIDHLAISHGFVPNLDLALNLGCALETGSVFSGRLAVDAAQWTSISGVAAAGESTGIGGGIKAAAEGIVAARSIAASLGYKTSRGTARASALRAKEFARIVVESSGPPAKWREILTPDTIICRCEDVTYGAIVEALAVGASDCRSVKGLTRCGMGLCQGRTCGPVLQALVSPTTQEPALGLQRRTISTPLRLADIANTDIRPKTSGP